MLSRHARNPGFVGAQRQRGITTLAITIILLVILTVMVLFSANVGFFEQRTATNENRSMAAEQIAEYSLNLAGEYLKTQNENIIDRSGSGWLNGAATGAGWVPCPVSGSAAPHPCAAEPNLARQSRMYYFDNDRSTSVIDPLPYTGLTAARTGALTAESTTSTTRFTGTTAVNALLCRINPDAPASAPGFPCQSNPGSGPPNVAITLIAENAMADENAGGVVKETWATAIIPGPSSPVPLVASGLIEGSGNMTVVASPNAGGIGIPGSMWSPNNIDIGKSGAPSCGGSGLGSPLTCHLGDYLGTHHREELLTVCAGSGNPCGCPSLTTSGMDGLSGHSGSTRKESVDILDVDTNCGDLPDITYFPGKNNSGTRMDDTADTTDDSLFEFIFDLDIQDSPISTSMNCVPASTTCDQDRFVDKYGLNSSRILNNCNSLDATSSGYYWVNGDCRISSDVGSPTSAVTVVVNGDLDFQGSNNFYGMLFAHDAVEEDREASLSGGSRVFGSLVVEGDVRVVGNFDLVYYDFSTGNNNRLPDSAVFGKVPGSWLDNRTSF